MKVTSIILAGGKNQRLGKNKAIQDIGGKKVIERVLERLRPLSDQILIVVSQQSLELPAFDSVEITADLYPDKGPLGGIYTGLAASGSPCNIVVACDMPFLNTGLLQHMVVLSEGFEAVVPRLGDKMLEPLHAVYSRDCLNILKSRLENNLLSVNQMVSSLRVRFIEKEECRKFYPELLSFFNINYPADLARARTLAKR